jgi:hypothetical protein
MPAVINTAAKFWQQFEQAIDTTTATALPCTIVKVMTGGSRVNVAVEQPTQSHQTPQGAWVENNVPFVETGVAPPASGFFVTASNYAPPAPPQDGGGDDSGGSGGGTGGSST